MSLLRFHAEDNSFELAVVSIEDNTALPNCGDVYVAVKVVSHGFSGHSDLWVLASEASQFCRQLIQLNETLRGEAHLSSISPGELSLRVRSLDSLGHVAVEGTIGFSVYADHRPYFHATTFGFEFDQSQLDSASKLPWIISLAT